MWCAARAALPAGTTVLCNVELTRDTTRHVILSRDLLGAGCAMYCQLYNTSPRTVNVRIGYVMDSSKPLKLIGIPVLYYVPTMIPRMFIHIPSSGLNYSQTAIVFYISANTVDHF